MVDFDWEEWQSNWNCEYTAPTVTSISEAKFKIGDNVYIYGSENYNKGTVKENYGRNSWGVHEYYIDFGEKGCKYCYETELDFLKKDVDNSKDKLGCECGAVKVYGSNCSIHHHSHWCSLRSNI